MIHLTNDNFKTEVHGHQGVVLVDFYTLSCGPCRQLKPILEAAALKFKDIRFCAAEVSDCDHYFGEYGITYVPQLFLFKGDKVIDKAGFLGEKELHEWLTEKGK